MVGDPCSLITPLYSVQMVNNGIQFTNQSTGIIDDYLYNFGDGLFSNSENPFHIYSETGTYNACLLAIQEEFNCEVEYCDSIQVVISSINSIPDSKLSVYPNPISNNVKELFIDYSGNSEIKETAIQVINSVGATMPISNFKNLGLNSYAITLRDNLEKGIYFIIIKENGRRISKKLIVI